MARLVRLASLRPTPSAADPPRPPAFHPGCYAERDLGRLAAGADIVAAAAGLVGVCHDEVLAAVLPGLPRTPAAVESVVTTLLDGFGPALIPLDS
ncbi:hypothetical protein AB0N05_15330 [Nocardia sp. NPDC051030]|uniref:hypothetical protein n=1 Tax=Nocardia sp. NPDC051030 TaxID=3155162 RepID=UPI00344722A4